MRWLALLLLLTACDFSQANKKDLERAGYTQVEITGSSYDWHCGKMQPAFNHKFKAVNPKGKRVTGTICGAALFTPIFEDDE